MYVLNLFYIKYKIKTIYERINGNQRVSQPNRNES